MRLRLSVQRHNLPTTKILWNVPNTASPSSYTIARLLEDVNQVLPLEAEQWGLEDYVVELAGYECLHFQNVWDTLKEDDALSIRPLMTAEVRSRTLTGRYQISEDGRRLLDGVPFGRPYLKQPTRPAVRIPPRKRRRIEEDAVVGLEEGLMIMGNGEMSPQGDEEGSRSKSSMKSVQFMDVDGEEDGSEEDNDDEFAPDNDESSASGSSSSGSDTNSDQSESEDSKSDDSSSDSSSDDSDDSDDSDESTKARSSHQHAPPGKGSKDTKARNRRRAASQRLRALKEAGKIHRDATLEDYRRFLEAQKTSDDTIYAGHTKLFAVSQGKRKRLDEDMGDTVMNEAEELARRKQKMLADIGEEGSKAATAIPAIQMKDLAKDPVPAPDSPPDVMSSKPAPAPARPTVRLRPDTAAIGRMLMRQTKNIEKKSAKAKEPVVETPPEPEGINEPDFWKSRINLSAFECWEEDYELSAPPFPFKQHWDPASQIMRDRQNKKKSKGKKKPLAPSSEEEEEEEEEEKIFLNYDDEDDPEHAKQDSDPKAAIENQIIQNVEVAAHANDLPALPEDMNSLSELQMSDIQVGAIVAFKLWVIDPKTFTPEITDYKTAIVEKEGDSGNGAGQFRLKLANRDVPKKEEPQEDGEGRRNRNPHANFKIKDDDEEEEDASVWEGSFAELVEPKLVQAAT